MKNYILASLFVFAMASAAKADFDPVTIYECVGDAAKTLPSELSVWMKQKSISIAELSTTASRLFKNIPPQQRVYVSASPYGDSDTFVFVLNPGTDGSGKLEATVQTPVGVLTKVYECKAVARQG